MRRLFASYTKKAQLKIQQMSFVLVAIVIFFALVSLVYFSISFSSLQEDAEQLRKDEAKQLVRKLSNTPEFAFTSETDCAICIDFDKAMQLANSEQYKNEFHL